MSEFKVLTGKGWLDHVAPEFRDTVLNSCVSQSFDRGQMIYDVDEPADGLIRLISGQVQRLLGHGNQIQALVHLAQPGDWFGGAAVLSGSGRTVGLQAKSAAKVADLSQRSIETIVEVDPTALRSIGVLPVSNISAALMTIEVLMIREPHIRCVAVLLRLANCRNKGADEAIARLNQSELTAMSNTARSAVAALLANLERERLVVRGYGQIRTLYPDRLRLLLTG